METLREKFKFLKKIFIYKNCVENRPTFVNGSPPPPLVEESGGGDVVTEFELRLGIRLSSSNNDAGDDVPLLFRSEWM